MPRRRIEPGAVALFGVTLLSIGLLVACMVIDANEPLWTTRPWLITVLAAGGLSFGWGVAVVISERPLLQTWWVGLMVILTTLVIPIALWWTVALAAFEEFD